MRVGGKKKEEKRRPLQNAYLDWKRRVASKAQPKKKASGGALQSGSKGGGGAKARADDDDGTGEEAEAKKGRATAAPPAAGAKKPAPYVADAYVSKGAATSVLDRTVDWYTNDSDLGRRLQAWFVENADKVPPIDMKKIGEGEYSIEAFSLFQEYTALLDSIVKDYLTLEGASFDDLHALAKDETNVAYSDAWMFVTLFSACTTFLFFADMLKQAQEGDLEFSTTLGLNPKYNV